MNTGKDSERPRRPLFARGADGSLRAADQTDIGDMWAQQQRMSLQEAIESDKKRQHKRHKSQRPKPSHKAPETAKSAADAADKTIEINIKMPSRPDWLSWQSAKQGLDVAISWVKGLKRSTSLTVVVILGLMLLLLGYNLVFNRGGSGNSSTTGKAAGGSIKGTPTFNTILPSDKNIQELGGWARVSPPNAPNPTYAYVDELQGVKINVSQQLIPKNFRADVAGSVKNLATQFNAKQTIEIDGGVAYLGNSTDGVQSLVFAKHDLLILIKAASQLPDDAWADYINSLE